MNSTSIDRLPPEMICKILENLNLDELINSKLVCKQWHSIISELVRLTKLVVVKDYNHEYYCDKFWRRRWYHSNELTNQDLEHCEFNSFLTHFKKNILSNLKKLKIVQKLSDPFDLNQLNLFTKLIHLEIVCRLESITVDHLRNDIMLEKKWNLNLNLSDLEVFKFSRSSPDCILSIECPKLKVLDYSDASDELDNVDPMNIKYPESVKVLRSDFIRSKLARFKNVEDLEVYSTCFIEVLNESTLRNLRHLKTVNCLGFISDLLFDFNNRPLNERISEMKSILKNFLKSAKKLKMFGLKLNVCGLQVTEHNIDLINFVSKMRDFGGECIDDYDTYAVNYKYFQDYSPFIDSVDYTQLSKSFNQIKEDYSSKFLDAQRITATGLIDQEHFLSFLKNLDCFKQLELTDTNLTQSFFDELPTFCSLTGFILLGDEDLELNFDFIAKFSKLLSLRIDRNLNSKSATSLIKAFGNLKYLMADSLDFRFKKDRYRIRRKQEVINRIVVRTFFSFVDEWYPKKKKPEHGNKYDVLVLTNQTDRTLKENNLDLVQVMRYFEELE